MELKTYIWGIYMGYIYIYIYMTPYMGSVEAVEMVLLVGPAAEVSVLRRWILQAFRVYLCLFFFFLPFCLFASALCLCGPDT